MKKTLLTLIVLSFVIALTACPSSQPTPQENPAKGPEVVNEQPADAQPVPLTPAEGTTDAAGTTTITGDDGATTVITNDPGATTTATQGLPPGWPEDLLIMPGFTATTGMVSTSPDGKHTDLTVDATGNAPITDVIKFYKELPNWTPSTGIVDQIFPDNAVIAIEKDDLRAMITITKSADSTQLNITLLKQ